MAELRQEGREIVYDSDLRLVATVEPAPDFASALGIAGRMVQLWNAAEGITLSEAVIRLKTPR